MEKLFANHKEQKNMKFSMVSGDVLKLECGALVVGIPAGGLTPTAEALDKASEGVVSRWIGSRRYTSLRRQGCGFPRLPRM